MLFRSCVFLIYAVKSIDQGIEVLTGVEAGIKQPDGTYPKDTINHLAYEKLKNYAYISCRFGDDD